MSSSHASRANFHTTRWSVVVAAGAQSREALASLCSTYWYPLYAYARRSGRSADDARDLTQGFFARLLEKHDLARADRERGRFRTYLLTAFQHFMANERDRERALKRGGAAALISIDGLQAETRYSREPADPREPQRMFEREWALALLDRALTRLAAEQAHAGKSESFEVLRVHLTAGADPGSSAEIAERAGLTENAARVALHRLRKRYGELLRLEVAETLPDGREIEDEIRDLFDALKDPHDPARNG
jgi:RNA polymerase sigma-70 factor (ECF subfamily)